MMRARTVVSMLALMALAASASAQDYPSRLIKLMHGFPAGGNVDVLARITSEEMAKGLGQPVVLEAKPGVVGSLAAETVARAAPDGYTLLFLPSAHAVTAAIYKSIKYDAVDDFSWISTVSFYPFILCVRKDSKFQTLADLLQQARARPGGLTFGSTGVGSIHHMTVELLANATQTKYINVSYRGEGQVLTGLLSGDVDFAMATVTVAAPHIESGAVRAIGVTGKARWRDLPQVPTLEEAGVAGYDVISWSGFAAPARTPRPIIDRIHAEVQRVIQLPGIKTRLENLGGDVRGTTPQEMRSLVERQVAMWRKLAQDAKIEAQ